MTDFNGFKGRAKKINDYDLPRIGHKIGVGEDEMHAILDVESNGSGFDSKGRPRILFERHWFYRFLKSNPTKLKKAVDLGLAVPSWSRATYNKDQYQLLQRALEIDETAALKSASWGLGQVMGFNHSVAGYDTVQEFVLGMMDDEANHLEAMVNFIINNGLDDEIRRHDWAGFARGYNGAGYKANNYHTRLASAYRKWSKIKDTPWSPEMAVEETKKQEKKLDKVEPIEEVTLPYETVQPEIVQSPDPVLDELPKNNIEEKKSISIFDIIVTILKTIFGRK